MKGEIKYIKRRGSYGNLYDQNGTLRWFDRGELDANDGIGKNDVVRFDLDGNRVCNITLYKRHRKGIVFSFG